MLTQFYGILDVSWPHKEDGGLEIPSFKASKQRQEREGKQMKNAMKKVMLCLCAMTVMASMSACTSAGKPVEPSPTATAASTAQPSPTVAPSASATQPSSNLPVGGKYDSIEAFINSDMMKAQMQTQTQSLEGSGMTLELAADGNKLIYNFTFEDEALTKDTDALKAGLEAGVEAQTATFESVAASLKAAVEVENPVVVIRYLDHAGEEIFTHEFSGK